jgi:hypothetical protein
MKNMFALLIVALGFGWSLSAKDPTKRDHMRNAIGHLEAAQTAKEPLTSLQAARRELVKAKTNKEGQRKDAIEYVDEAIALARTGDSKAMQEKITKAISNVKSGIARSK